MDKNSRGFIQLFVIIAVFLTTLGGVGYSVYQNSKNIKTENNLTKPTPSIENKIVGVSPTPKITSAIKPTSKPTNKSTTTPVINLNSGSSCSYNLTASTGSIKVNIQAQSGSVIGDQIVELQAKSGCNVLVNKSADKDTRIARQGSPTIDFSQVPPGSYSVRIQYKGQWTSYQSISVNSGQQTVATVTVSGDVQSTNTPSPVPTSKPKPSCLTPSTYPSSGSAPLSVLFSGTGSAGDTGSMIAYEWDFTGDGSWDVTGNMDAQNYTYQSSGNYTVKVRVLSGNGEYSDVCQATITVN